MNRRRGTACGIAATLVAWIAASVISLNGQSASSKPSPSPASTDAYRTLLDRYCVTCHNDRLKTANLSLQRLDLTKVADQPELCERVIRKLRAGVMPPPDVARPPLADYDALRDWLENEIDRAADTRAMPGSVVLHRLNRTEYA